MANVTEWTVDDVIQQLGTLGLSEYSRNFQNNDISGDVLPYLTEDHLKELGMTKVGHRLKFLKFVRNAKTNFISDIPTPSSRSHPSNPESTRSRLQATSTMKQTQFEKPRYKESEPEFSTPDEEEPPPKPSTAQKSSQWEQKRRQMMMRKMAAGQGNQSVEQTVSSRSRNNDMDSMTITSNKSPSQKPPTSSSSTRKANNGFGSTTSSHQKPAAPKTITRKMPPPPSTENAIDNRVGCRYCGRKFAPDRIEKHEEACARMANKKVKVFNAAKQRLQGTEAAQFAGKSKDVVVKKKNFRAEHEKLVAQMRAARKMDKYINDQEAGIATGPPPEMPHFDDQDEEDDRVTCPHCGRKFGAEAAARHIPVCERMSFGKGRDTKGAKKKGRF